jgi:DNA-binding beta-propeller fold protein YncE
MRLVATIPLPGVEGRIDHLALDPVHHRLFVAALGSDRVEVIDLARNRRAGEIESLPEPQGVLFVQERQRLYVTLGEAAHVAVFKGSDLSRVRRILTRTDPDNIRYEPGADRIWIGEGEGQQGALAAFAPDGEALLCEIALDDHPESFQLEGKGPRIFVNVPARQEVEVVDREKRSVVARWTLPCSANFPMALDETHARLFVGCRRPARLLELDTNTGRVVAEADAPADADDLYLDPATGRIYVSSGAGVVRIYVRGADGRLEDAGDVPTAAGARTSLFDAESKRLYVAVPRRSGAPAEIQVFDTSE